jgi:hypothetical protein
MKYRRRDYWRWCEDSVLVLLIPAASNGQGESNEKQSNQSCEELLQSLNSSSTFSIATTILSYYNRPSASFSIFSSLV